MGTLQLQGWGQHTPRNHPSAPFSTWAHQINSRTGERIYQKVYILSYKPISYLKANPSEIAGCHCKTMSSVRCQIKGNVPLKKLVAIQVWNLDVGNVGSSRLVLQIWNLLGDVDKASWVEPTIQAGTGRKEGSSSLSVNNIVSHSHTQLSHFSSSLGILTVKRKEAAVSPSTILSLTSVLLDFKKETTILSLTFTSFFLLVSHTQLSLCSSGSGWYAFATAGTFQVISTSGALVVSQFQDPVQSSPDDMLLLLLVHFRLFTVEMEGSSSLSVNNIVSHTPVSKFLLICLCCRCVDRYISGFTFEKAAVSPSILSILPIWQAAVSVFLLKIQWKVKSL